MSKKMKLDALKVTSFQTKQQKDVEGGLYINTVIITITIQFTGIECQ